MLVYEAFSYLCMRPSATSVVYAALGGSTLAVSKELVDCKSIYPTSLEAGERDSIAALRLQWRERV
jgi:hypothetical protein